MVWTGDARYRLAPALLTLLHQLQADYPGAGWLNSPQTGTIGDAAHFAEGSASDHNPWLDGTVRALDIAADVSGVPGVVPVRDAPDCEALFGMVNRMYAARDVRVYPDGYAIYRGRITDWDNPGGYHAQQGDPHQYHLHISVSRNPAGFGSTAPWPVPGEQPMAGPGTPAAGGVSMAMEDAVFHVIRNQETGAVRACGPSMWVSLNATSDAETQANIDLARGLPTCASQTVEEVSSARMAWLKRFYTTGTVSE
ncbi:MAG TPA: hypothetical protein VMB79_04580 [Jatrophihabitans sp.]|nr:hypothetical protein [Jatrophihabitans sp.]